MDYKEKYEEALEKAKIWQKHLNETGDKDFADELIYIFPELKESEGEKVRKEILEVAKTVVLRDGTLYGKKYNCREWIAWLEKLKVFAEHGAGLYYFGNSSFTYIGSPIWDNDSWLEKQEQKKCIDDLTQQEAMDIAVAKCFEQSKQKHVLDIEIPFGAKDSELQEATYLIPEGFHAEIKDNEVLIKKGKQKSAWSEADDLMLTKVINFIPHHMTAQSYNEFFNWLKSIKTRIKGE